ncbi:MAG: YifB family Mg chelatase-like AAA ATPase [Oscillospiraceae bacterium]|jgi:magnesium chelatase family protein|nr:YifB family Mg chelatase-like AAA ATPase [Oscillospiraceae bacterium]
MISKVRSMGLLGVSGYEVSVECYLSGGLPAFDVVGLPDAAVRESRERVRAAAKTGGFSFPMRRITVNLAPADTRKEGALYDLPILLGLLAAHDEIPPLPADAAFVGELSLEGALRPVCGALPMTLAAKRLGLKRFFIPAGNAREAALAEGIDVYPAAHYTDILAHLSGQAELAPLAPWTPPEELRPLPDFADVRGQENVKRALEIAAAGGHNILMVGPPGAGKSMLARRIPGILPAMTRSEMLQAIEIHSVAGLTGDRSPMLTARPFRAPHHTISPVGLSGGGSVPRPGEISLAHNGVLFLDELPEFDRAALEALRQPLEDGDVTIVRASGTLTYPALFMLVCAMNPCRCGWYGHPSGRCRCDAKAVSNYMGRVSGPLLDRIDMQIEVLSVDFDALASRAPAEPSAAVRARVEAARSRQRRRFDDDALCNARLSPPQMAACCELDEAGKALMKGAFDRLGLTARSYNRVLRVARTIADLEGAETITAAHLAEAVQYRSLERGPFA